MVQIEQQAANPGRTAAEKNFAVGSKAVLGDIAQGRDAVILTAAAGPGAARLAADILRALQARVGGGGGGGGTGGGGLLLVALSVAQIAGAVGLTPDQVSISDIYFVAVFSLTATGNAVLHQLCFTTSYHAPI